MIGNDHEKDLFSLLETLKDTMESQWVMDSEVLLVDAADLVFHVK